MRDKMDENELRDIIKDCKKKMEPDALKTQDQQLPQLCWILLLKCFEDFEKNRAVIDKDFKESIPKPFRWQDWASDPDRGKTGDALVKFDSIYIAFKDDFEESSLAWEALIDGEVTYQSSEITCIAINSYLNTGGAHGNMNISFLNFNSQTGELLKNDELIKNKINFIKIAEKYFNLQLQEASNENGFNDYFFGDGFQLPENIGFSDEGIILLYNVYEIAPYSEGITEFTIPFEEMLPYLKLN